MSNKNLFDFFRILIFTNLNSDVIIIYIIAFKGLIFIKKFFNYSISSITIFVLTIIIFFTPILAEQNFDFINSLENEDKEFITNNSSKIYAWPTPGYTTITCKFGYRKAPTTGASTYHGGIDIAVPTNSKIVACFSGNITYTGFYGANGYSIILENSNDSNITATYGHLSPNYIVKSGEHVLKKQVIGFVGPKNVYGVPNNKYTDSNRESNKRGYNRATLALCN